MMMSARSLTLGFTIFGVLAGRLLVGNPALAAQKDGFTGSFGSATSAIIDSAPLSAPAGIAVDQSSGNVYVADEVDHRVEQFSATGALIAVWGWGVGNGESKYEVCTSSSCEEGIAGSGEGQFSSPGGIAVDNDSSSASFGDVYVSDSVNGVVDKFTASGDYLSAITGTPEGSFGEVAAKLGEVLTVGGVAVDANGNVWLDDSGEPVGALEFDDAGNYVRSWTYPEHNGSSGPGIAVDAQNKVYLLKRSRNLTRFNALGEEPLEIDTCECGTGLAVDESMTEIDVDHGTKVVEYGLLGEPAGELGLGEPVGEFGSRHLHDGGGGGVAVNVSTGVAYVADTVTKEIDEFGSGAAPPAPPTTGTAREVERTSATLRGTLHSGSENVAFYFFYNEGSSCSGERAITTGGGEAESDTEESAPINGLEPHHLYTFCFIAENEGGQGSGGPVPFETLGAPPIVVRESTSSVGSRNATLEAQINPNNEATHYSFEYATNEVFTEATRVAGAGRLSGFHVAGEPATIAVSGLAPDTTYYYRAIAENEQSEDEGELAEGAIQEFKTGLAPPTVTTESLLGVTAGSATVLGTIDPNGIETSFQYEYGISIAYEQTSQTAHVGAGRNQVAAAAPLTDLVAGTLYHYRLVATNDSGTSYGDDKTFTTPRGTTPTAATGKASGVTANAATISGVIETEGLPTNYGFEVGIEAGNYDPPTGFAYVSPGFGEVAVAVALQNLQPGRTYHYRLAASNLYGTSTGADQSFTTPGIPSPLSQPGAAPLIATSAIAFPTEPGNAATTVRTLTRAQKLAKALKACKRRAKKQRRVCAQKARGQNGVKKARRG